MDLPKINYKIYGQENILKNHQNFVITNTKLRLQAECSNSDPSCIVPQSPLHLCPSPFKIVPRLQPPPTFTRRLIGGGGDYL